MWRNKILRPSVARKKTPEKATRSKRDYLCIICGSRFTRAASVNYHFPRCVEKYGNPRGNRWNDHHSCGGRSTCSPEESGTYVDEEEEEQEEDQVSIRYDLRTIASDFLRAIGEHPTLPPLNAHMEGHDLVSPPSVPPRIHLRLRSPRPPTEATDTSHRQSLRPNQHSDESDIVFQPSAPPRFRLRLRGPRPPTEVTDTSHDRSLRPNEDNDEAESVGGELGTILAEWRTRRQKEEVEEMAKIETNVETEEECNSRAPAQPSQSTPTQGPSGDSTLNQIHHRSRLRELPNGWEMRVKETRSGQREYFVDHNNRTTTWDDPRRLLSSVQP